MIIGNVAVWNQAEFVEQSQDLDQLARGDYEPVKRELARKYPTTTMAVRAIPFVERYIDELSGLYRLPLVRTFPDAADTSYRKMREVYAASDIDGVMSQVEDALWVQNTALLVVVPVAPGRVRVLVIMPWQVETVEIADPLDASDPSTWDRLVVSVPTSVIDGQVVMGRMELTRTTARRQVGGAWQGIYNDDTSHTFGRVPVVVARRVKPEPGRWAAPVRQAVLNLQLSLSVQAADDELIVKHCAWPQKVIEGADINQQVGEMQVGPDKIMTLMRSGNPETPSPVLRVVQGQVPVAELVSFAEHKIRLYCSQLGMDPSSFIRTNTAVTASARLFGAQDRSRLRGKIKPELQRAETQLAKLIAAVLDAREAVQIGQAVSVSIRYAELIPTADPNSAASARAQTYEAGTASPAGDLAREKGISYAAALAQVERNLAESRNLGVIDAPPPMGGADASA